MNNKSTHLQEYENIPEGIFIVGKERSGETWLGRLLSCHEDILTVTRQVEGNTRPDESYYFSHFMKQCGKIENDLEYGKYSRDFMKSKYYKNSGARGEYLKENPIYDKYSFYHQFMMDLATTVGKKTYIEKTPDNAIIMERINDNIENLRFLYVKRDIIDSVNSTLNMKSTRHKKIKSLKTLYETAVFDRYAANFAGKNMNIKIIDYDNLIKNREETLHKIMGFLNLPYEEGLGNDMKVPIPTKEKKGTMYFLSTKEERTYRLLYEFLDSMPMILLRMVNAIYLNLINRKYKRIPPKFY